MNFWLCQKTNFSDQILRCRGLRCKTWRIGMARSDWPDRLCSRTALSRQTWPEHLEHSVLPPFSASPLKENTNLYIIIFYFENVAFSHAKLGSDVRPRVDNQTSGNILQILTQSLSGKITINQLSTHTSEIGANFWWRDALPHQPVWIREETLEFGNLFSDSWISASVPLHMLIIRWWNYWTSPGSNHLFSWLLTSLFWKKNHFEMNSHL